MAAFATAYASPLTLSEQLDAMLTGWLERRADRRGPGRIGARAETVMAIADSAIDEVERFCERWAMTLERPARGTIAIVEGPALAVEGFTAISAMYRAA